MSGYSVPQLIREAVDFCPEGLCFSMPDGRPILVNRQMNLLVARLTGHTVLNAGAVWDELAGLGTAAGAERLKAPWWEDGEDRFGFRFGDGSVWQFTRRRLRDGEEEYLQLEASDLTELARLSRELYESNERLRLLHARQKKLMSGIVQINREKELLDVKMRVHDELGQCLLATKKALRDGCLSAEAPALTENWEDAIRGLSNIPLEHSVPDESPEAELQQVAGLIGCSIDFTGVRPENRSAQLLLYAAVREALTNAVRHAGADRLRVCTVRASSGWHIVISDNGSARPDTVREGGGLKSLRRRLEQEGASLRLDCRGGVRLTVDIPFADDERKTGETT